MNVATGSSAASDHGSTIQKPLLEKHSHIFPRPDSPDAAELNLPHGGYLAPPATQGTALDRIPMAPAYYPTEVQWTQDPIEYIESIRPHAEKYGICKIVPPPSFRPPFCVAHDSSLEFATRSQPVAKLEGSARVRSGFERTIRRFLFRTKRPLRSTDSFWTAFPGAKRSAHAFDVFRAVERECDATRMSPDQIDFERVCERIDVPAESAAAVREVFLRFCEGYWRSTWVGRDSSSLTDSPSSKTATKSEMSSEADSAKRRRVGDEDGLRAAYEEARRAVLNSLRAEDEAESRLMDEVNQINCIEGYRKRNHRHKVNLLSPETKLDAEPQTMAASKDVRTKRANELTNATVADSYATQVGMGSTVGGSEDSAATAALAARRGPIRSRKRTAKIGQKYWKTFRDLGLQTCCCEIIGFDKEKDLWDVQFESIEPTTKRKRKLVEMHSTADLEMFLASGATPEEAFDACTLGFCQACFRAVSTSSAGMLSCCDCGFLWHGSCLTPARAVPASTTRQGPKDWFCGGCLAEHDAKEKGRVLSLRRKHKGLMDVEETEADLRAFAELDRSALSKATVAANPIGLADFGFEDGESFTFDEYCDMANEFYEKHVERPVGRKNLSTSDVERLFWDAACGLPEARLLPRNDPRSSGGLRTKSIGRYSFVKPSGELEVFYGNDLNTDSGLGSGFPRASDFSAAELAADQKLREYCAHGWNLNNLPRLRGSLLQYVEGGISGIVVPWLYMGMSLTAFCWHVEDHMFSSINYNHFGAPKSWWGVPSSGFHKFEAAAKTFAPELFASRPDILSGIVTQFRPDSLAEAGVPTYHLVQHPGEYVITFPQSYHGGVNLGLNCAEAVNFATTDWLRYGASSAEVYAGLKKSPIIAHESLMCSLTKHVVHELTKSDKDDTQLPFLVDLWKHLAPNMRRVSAREATLRSEFMQRYPKCRVVDSAAYALEKKSIKSENEPRKEPVAATKGGGYSSMMSRTGGLAHAFKNAKRCADCKRYCALAFVRQVDPATREPSGVCTCIGHASALMVGGDAELVTPYDLGDLVELTKVVESIQ